MRPQLVVLVMVLLSTFLLSATEKSKFIIAVIGDGVPSEIRPPTRQFPLNESQGEAMWNGVSTALDSSPRLKEVRQLVELRGYDDAGIEGTAEKIAREIQSNPHVLAVIGHATSGTTRAAAWLYAQAGIPLLMPIATSPYAMYPPGKEKDPQSQLKNVFRLPPSDDKVQAPAVVFVALEILRAEKFYLIGDTSEGAKEYSNPLYEAVEYLLAGQIVFTKTVDRAKTKFSEVASSIQAQGADLVVFCGYGTTAQELFQALREKYRDRDISERPKILLTDGCLIEDLNTSGFYTYLTFPAKGIRNYKDSSDDLDILRHLILNSGKESYEMYGYDAMLIIGKAVLDCREAKNISRGCILQKLSDDKEDFEGAAELYSFRDGENIHCPYYIYADTTEDNAPGDFSLMRELSSKEIKRFRIKRTNLR